SAATLAIASAVLAAPAAATAPDAVPSAQALGSLVLLGLACTALAFVCFYALVAAVGAGRATGIAYVAPVGAVAGGMAILDERPGPWAFVGLLLIVAGSWLATRRAADRERTPPALRPTPDPERSGRP